VHAQAYIHGFLSETGPTKPGTLKLLHYTNPKPNLNPKPDLLFLALFLALISNPNSIPISNPIPNFNP